MSSLFALHELSSCARPTAEGGCRYAWQRALLRAVVILVVFAAPTVFAASLNGTVTNGTSNQPAVGDEVVLIELGAGMEEVGHAKTDTHGKFSFSFDGATAPRLVRAIHQGVTYHKPAPPGTTSVELQVYDVRQKVQEVHAVADLMYLQARQGQLGVTRIFAVDNKSNPPLTQMGEANFEFYVPEGAKIDDGQAQTAGGQPIRISPTPQTERGRYAFAFPLRPGQTEFQVTYHMAYAGKATIDPRSVYSLQHFVAMMARSISFIPVQSGVYESRQPPDLPDAVAEVANNPRPGQKLSFEISGEGVLQDQNQNASSDAGGTAATADNRPGGGLGKPIEAPDPLDKIAVAGQGPMFSYRVVTLLGLVLALVAGAVYTVRHSAASRLAATTSSGRSAPLLDALKEELFQLEVEHKQGQISDADYAAAKAALDQTLSRAIKRSR